MKVIIICNPPLTGKYAIIQHHDSGVGQVTLSEVVVYGEF